MTYRERLQRTNPKYIDSKFIGGCAGCPGSKFKGAPTIDENPSPFCAKLQCEACWNMEIPKTPTVFIIGPIDGVAKYWEAFERAEDELTGRGIIALSPSRLPSGMTFEQYGRIYTTMIDVADAVLVLDGWETYSKALQAVAYCRSIGKPVLSAYQELEEVFFA